MPIATSNVMKMRKMLYFYISMDSRVKIGCFLNNIVVIAQHNISSISKWCLIEPLYIFLVSHKWPFLKAKI